MKRTWLTPVILFAAICMAQPVWAFKFDLHGSLGEGKNKHKRYVPPVSNPLFNETPYITTEVRPIWMHQQIPSSFLTGGGTIDVFAAEIRVAINDRLGIIATKDGYADLDFKAGLPDENGFANLSLGFKYALINRPDKEGILTVGLEYEPPSGDLKTGAIRFQGGGDGFFDLFLTGAKAYGKFGVQGNLGANLALDGDYNTSMFHWAMHADYEILKNVFPLVELNGFSVIDDGKRFRGFNFEGMDLVNFGSGSAGTIVTVAAGARYKIMDHIMIGASYETPISNQLDLLLWRTTTDLVIYF